MWGNSTWNPDDPDLTGAYSDPGTGVTQLGGPDASVAAPSSGNPLAMAKGMQTGQPGAAPSLGGSVAQNASKGAPAGPWGAAIGAGLGLLKYQTDKADYAKASNLAANTERLSWITGMHGKVPQPISPWNNSVAMGSQGAAYGQSMDNAKAQTQLQEAYLNNMNASTAAITRGQFAPVAQYGSMGRQSPQTRVSDSIWNDPGLTDPSSVGPDGYARSTRWGS